MKKRLLALLLAGLLTAGMVSCTTETQRGNENTGGTEEQQTRPNEDETQTPTLQWTDVDDYVYVIAKDGITLIAVDGGATVKVANLTKLHRTRVSNSTRCEVEKDGVKYYADNAKVTADDILGENFTTLASPKTMYAATNGLNVREYASISAKSLKSLELNDTVTVVATGAVGDVNWSKIKLADDSFAFVSTKYLSESAVVDPDSVDYSENFTDLTEAVTKYVNLEKMNLRKNATKASTSMHVLVLDEAVTVIATGVVDGKEWSRVKYVKKGQAGDPDQELTGYVQSDCLSAIQSTTAVTLDVMIERYPAFTKLAEAKTMYATGGVSVRPSPDLEGSAKFYLEKQNSVKVVATGNMNEIPWAMIEHVSEGKTSYLFVSMNYLTVDSSGEPVLDLDTLVTKYSLTKLAEAKTMYASEAVNCRTTPDTSKDVDKKLEKGAAVTVYASGTVNNSAWYLLKVEGSEVFYFAGSSLFSESNG